MLSTATSASCFLYNKKKEIKRKSFRLPAVVPIVLYNGTNKWTSARNFKDIITGSQLFGDNILDFKYILVDINRYSKEYLYEFKNIASAILLLDQDINAMEFLERLKNIVINFNSLTYEEKLLLKGWIKNTTNNNEIINMNELVENIFNNEMEVESMVSNAPNIFDKLKKEAIKEGLDEGKKEGKREGKSELLITQLIKRFNGLSDYYIENIENLPEESIDLIATNIFDLEKIEDIKKYL
ncbi:Rpn family recombination-promoting nuclease/putative transposase [Clostridium tagluense]|uniref:Rpn family recombination-promoting nuclease/putative transposase n=1 Tax=Clostridium tagluense TaxID=360422 RepID=UPI001C0BF58C|nr:Rpn family recombination-promoting nuclease/putative transposase [Clostridium tagluense]MBU3130718.1 Rpn family recombination-promoting nuclease/putative transposase [Clostridium tagluense]